MIEKLNTTDYLARLHELTQSDDTEGAHGNADDILCEILSELGYDDIVETYNRVNKWYA
jgi:hypothetical protein